MADGLDLRGGDLVVDYFAGAWFPSSLCDMVEPAKAKAAALERPAFMAQPRETESNMTNVGDVAAVGNLAPVDRAILLVVAGDLAVSEDGSVWSLTKRNRYFGERRPEPLRADRPMKRGYRIVPLRHDGKAYLVPAHRLVWALFRGPIPPKMDINHIDGNKHNNALTNLELATRSENIQHARDTGLRTQRNVAQEIAAEVAWRVAAGELRKDIAAQMHLSVWTIYNALEYARRPAGWKPPRRAAS